MTGVQVYVVFLRLLTAFDQCSLEFTYEVSEQVFFVAN